MKKIYNNTNYKEKEYKYIRTKNLYKKRIIVFVVIIIVLISNSITYALASKNLIEYFFKKNSEYKENTLLEKVGDKKKIDNYTIEFKEQLYDDKTGFGYLVFVTTKENGVPVIPQNVSTEAFGENSRFCFEMDKAFNVYHEIIDKKLYSYIEFNDMTRKERINVSVIDTINEEKYEFNIKSSGKNVCYKNKNGDTMVTISPLGLRIDSNKCINEKKINVVLKNKKKIQLCNTDSVK